MNLKFVRKRMIDRLAKSLDANTQELRQFINDYDIYRYDTELTKEGPEWYIARLLKNGSRTKRYLSEYFSQEKDITIYPIFDNARLFENRKGKLCFIISTDIDDPGIDSAFKAFLMHIPGCDTNIGLHEMHSKYHFVQNERQLIMFWNGD